MLISCEDLACSSVDLDFLGSTGGMRQDLVEGLRALQALPLQRAT